MRRRLIMFLVHAIWPVLTSGQQPEFNISPVNVTAIKGQPAILPCSVRNKEGFYLVWMNPRKTLLSSDDRRLIDDTRMSIERPFVPDWNLHIRNVQVQDDGVYTCQINTDPIQIKRIRLKVQVPAQIDNSSSSTNSVVREGQTVNLQCVATGIPEPTINWYRMTPQTNLMKEHVGTTGELLIIHNISRYCGGMYECEASNNIALPVSRVMKIEVEFAPEVRFKTPRRISQSVGKEVMLECFVAAFPQGVSTWNKDGKPVGEGSEHTWKYRTEIYREDEFTFAIYLRIINLEKHDFGEYSCEALNPLGTDSDTILLTEYFEPTAPPSTITPLHSDNDPWQPSRQPPLNVGERGNQLGYNTPNRGYVGAGDSYSSTSASTFQRFSFTVYTWMTSLVTLLALHTLFPS